jgi:hypothetical protein
MLIAGAPSYSDAGMGYRSPNAVNPGSLPARIAPAGRSGDDDRL